MEFARARTQEQVMRRQEEIINACNTLFSRYGYDGVNFKAISTRTSITRPSIYNYYETKDEILLDLLKREILRWQARLMKVMHNTTIMTKEQFSAFLTESLVEHWKLGELFSLQYPVLEKNCAVEKLTDLGKVIVQFEAVFAKCLDMYFPTASPENKAIFMMVFFPFVRGLYPTSNITPQNKKRKTKQRSSDDILDSVDFRQTCYEGTLFLLSDL